MQTQNDPGTTVSATGAEDPLVLALDVGTSSARAAVYDATGRGVENWIFQTHYDVETTLDGGAVLRANAVQEAVFGCLDGAERALAGRKPAVVATDTFWHSVLGVDQTLKPVTPVYTWADTRAADVAAVLRSRLSDTEVHARTGCGLYTNYLPAKLLWLKLTNPDAFHKSVYWMSFGEWLYAQLFGTRRVSISMASGSGLLNQLTMQWDPELLSFLGISAQQLSDLADYADSPAQLPAPRARRWPSLSGIPWLLPLGDGACNNAGSAGLMSDWMVAMIGTSGALRVISRVEPGPLPTDYWTYRVDREWRVQGGALSAGGNIVNWLETNLRLPPIETLEQKLSIMPPDGHGLTVLPYLAGERSPDWNPKATAAVVGLTLHTDPEAIALAFLEAVAYQFARVYGILKQRLCPAGVIGSGAGLVRAPIWIQILSDVLGTPVVASRAVEATSRGAAVLALRATGLSPAPAASLGPLGTKYASRDDRTRVYAAAMERQDRLYAALNWDGAMRRNL